MVVVASTQTPGGPRPNLQHAQQQRLRHPKVLGQRAHLCAAPSALMNSQTLSTNLPCRSLRIGVGGWGQGERRLRQVGEQPASNG